MNTVRGNIYNVYESPVSILQCTAAPSKVKPRNAAMRSPFPDRSPQGQVDVHPEGCTAVFITFMFELLGD